VRKKTVAGTFVLLLALFSAFALTAFGDEKLPVFKVGETIYVCGCGAGCDCRTISRNDGKCTCDKPLVKTTIAKVEGGKLFASVNGEEQAYPTKAKYACACGAGCTCGTISQKAGKCTCGNKMKKI